MVFWSPGRFRKTFLKVMGVSDCVSCGGLSAGTGTAAGVSLSRAGVGTTAAETSATGDRTGAQLPSAQISREDATADSAFCWMHVAFAAPATVTSKTANSLVRKTK